MVASELKKPQQQLHGELLINSIHGSIKIMANKLVILIEDKDCYFIKGLRGLLESHFYAQGYSVDFIECFTSKKPDIVFHAQNPGEITGFCHQRSEKFNYPYYFIIRDKKYRRLCQTKNCIRNSAIIYRHQTSDEFIAVIKKVVSVDPSQPSHPSICSVCHNPRLSLREREVLFYLNSGLNQTQIAQYMQLKVKTINSHKSSAMKKLNFKHNLALVHWMLRGGLY